MTILSDSLNEIARVRATGAGTAETSDYGARQGALKPRVFCIPQLASKRKPGHPDFGLFAQLRGRRRRCPDRPPARTGRAP
jgi:hypothetical protein